MTRFIPPKNPSLEGKVLVISGGSSGIGERALSLSPSRSVLHGHPYLPTITPH